MLVVAAVVGELSARVVVVPVVEAKRLLHSGGDGNVCFHAAVFTDALFN
jgi:hypothetical protein